MTTKNKTMTVVVYLNLLLLILCRIFHSYRDATFANKRLQIRLTDIHCTSGSWTVRVLTYGDIGHPFVTSSPCIHDMHRFEPKLPTCMANSLPAEPPWCIKYNEELSRNLLPTAIVGLLTNVSCTFQINGHQCTDIWSK